MYITRQQQQQILKQIPQGQDPAKVFQAMIDKGAQLEGFAPSFKSTPTSDGFQQGTTQAGTQQSGQPQQQDGFFKTLVKDPIKTLIVKPGVRVGQAIAAPALTKQQNTNSSKRDEVQKVLDAKLAEARNTTDPQLKQKLFAEAMQINEVAKRGQLQAEKIGQRAQMLDSGNTQVSLPGAGNFDIEAQRSGVSGLKQVAGDAFKTASYLYTPGATSFAGKGITGAAVEGAKAGAIGGGLYGASDIGKENSTIGSTLGSAVGGALVGGIGGALVGGGIEAASEIVKKLAKVGPGLEKSNFRLSPTQERNAQKKLMDASQFVNEKIPVGGPEARFSAATDHTNALEERFQNFLDTKAKNVKVPKDDLLSVVDGLKSEFKNERDYLVIKKQIDNFITLIKSEYPDQIPLTELNKLKRSTFESAFNQAGDKVSDIVEYKIGDVLKTGVERATSNFDDHAGRSFKELLIDGQTVRDFNHDYSIAITARKLLRSSVGKPQMGFTERLLADAIGLGTGGPGGAIVSHAVTNYAPFTAGKALLGKTTTKLSKTLGSAAGVLPKIIKPKMLGPLGAATVAGLKDNSNP